MLLGQLNHLGQRAGQRGRHQFVARALDGFLQLTGQGPHQAGEGQQYQSTDQAKLAGIVEPVHQRGGGYKEGFHDRHPEADQVGKARRSTPASLHT